MGNVEFDDIDLYKFVIQVEQIGNIGVKNAIEENRAKGIPSVYMINGKIVYELPNGELTYEVPEIYKD